MTATAAWDAPRLLDALSRRGWGDLDGRACGGLRSVLRALVALLPYESAEGRVTAAQVADAAGMSTKWARRCLAELEDRGLITWRRGYLKEGRPQSGWVRVSKAALAAMVRSLRDALDERRERRKAETRHRLATTLHSKTLPPWRKRHRPLSSRWELSSTLPTPKGSTAAGAYVPPPSQTLPGIEVHTMAACAICGKSPDACKIANAKVRLHLQHDFIPGRSYVPAVVAPAHELQHSPHQQQRKAWRERVAELAGPAQDTLEGE